MNKKTKNIPKTMGIIMDGNRRWAKKRGKNSLAGHTAGFETLKETAKWAAEAGVEYLVVYALSTENWNRSKTEVAYIMRIFENALVNEFKKFEDVRVKFIGDKSRFSKKIQKFMANVEEESAGRKGLTLVPAVSYGGRDEILRAVNKISSESSGKITENRLDEVLDTKDIPDPDLIIRTSGEMRLSGFLPWQTVYSELFFTDTLWPDFSKKEFNRILKDYSLRMRRYGK